MSVAQTGQGSVATFTTGGTVFCARNITLPNLTMETIDASCLDSTGFTYKISGDLVDAGECVITAIFPVDQPLVFPSVGATDTLTITIPLKGGAGTGTLSGTGFISSTQMPTLGLNELMEVELTFVFDGVTGPAWSEAS